ncbi:MAG: hypothetical protein ACOYNG_04130 [Terrimicrobiaceae bacterium]|jgi:hypothetical protein
MNPALAGTQESNPIHIGRLFQSGLIVVAVAGIALAYVYVKMRQHSTGAAIRITEQQIREVRAENEVLLARISHLTSPANLRARVNEGFIKVVGIKPDSIGRLTPPEPATEDGVLRTAFVERPSP